MSDTFDHEGDAFDELGRGEVYGPPLMCRSCGSDQVYWQRTRAGYRLFDCATIEQHDCRGPATPDEFPAA